MRNLTRLLITSCLAGAAAPAVAQTANDNGVPVITPQSGDVYFRVPLQGQSTSNASTYAWVEDISACSTQCGTGTRTKSYQCQDLAAVDYVGGTGFGAAEQSSQCVSTVGAAPASTSESCTVYSGCSYTWVTPAVVQTVTAISPYPAGRVGCGQVSEQYSPYCQRSDGLVLSSADNNYCKNSSGYPVGQPSNSDSFGYNRTTIQTASCTTADHSWAAGSWSPWNSTCSDAATRTRSVTCNRNFDGTVQADSNCTASIRPAASETGGQYGSCTFNWNSGSWSPWSSSCSNTATRTRAVSCLRSDGTTVADASCNISTKPTSVETSGQYGSCTYSWNTGAWDVGAALCTASESQTRTVTCRRDLDGVTVSDPFCVTTKPATSQVVPDYSGCNFAWTAGAWSGSSSTCSASAVQTRSVTCQRSDGTTVADANCPSSSKPTSSQVLADYSGCSYAWNSGAWSASSSTCSASATQSRTVTCVRSDGTTVTDANCPSASKPATSQTVADYSGCGYNWNTGAWGAWSSTCSTSAVRTRAVTCQRTDGTTVADASCTATKPTTSEVGNLAGCTYSAGGSITYGGWSSTCSPSATRSVTSQCIRSDGTVAASTECTNRGISLTSTETAPNYSACSYSWSTGAWDTGSASCTASETQNRTVTCRRDIDGAVALDSQCSAAKPATSQTVPDYSGCSFSWSTGAWSGWSSTCSTSAVRTRSVTCVRSDGTVASDASCSSAKPDASEIGSNLSGCSYSANYGSWSSCNMGVQTRNNTCSRSDGQVFFDSVSVQTYCGIPATQTQACQSVAPQVYPCKAGAVEYATDYCGFSYTFRPNRTLYEVRTSSGTIQMWAYGSTTPNPICNGRQILSKTTTEIDALPMCQ